MHMLSNSTITYVDADGFERRLVVRLNEHSPVPRFEQLRAQLAVMISVGRLRPGSRLPTVRSMASQLGLAPGTVARTYRELQNDGSVVTNRRAGTVVTDEPPHSEFVAEHKRRIEEAADRLVRDLYQLGQNRDDIIAAVTDAIERSSTAAEASGA